MAAQPGGNDCFGATEICDFPVVGSNTGATATPPYSICGNPSWVENNVFYTFTATSNYIELYVQVSNCTPLPPVAPLGLGLQGEIYTSPDCINFTELACFTPPLGFPTPPPPSFTLSFASIVGEQYYLMLDGLSGDFCDYNISLVQGSISSNTQPIVDPPIIGADAVCVGDQETYSVSGNVNQFIWTINPPLGGIVGPDSGGEIEVMWNTLGVAEICVSGVGCGAISNPLCMTVEVTVPPERAEEVFVCNSGSVDCAGETFFVPGVYQVIVPSSPGCDSVVTCTVTLIPLIPVTNVVVDLCGPATYDVCGDVFSATGVYNPTCTSYLGCDSSIILDLAILSPVPNIAMPGDLDCGANSTLILDGSGSNINTASGGTTEYFWTGPGILGDNTLPTILINQIGNYCLQLTHARNGVSCSEMVCVDVGGDVGFPEIPSIAGDSLVCDGASSIYDAIPNGNAAVDNFIWTTPNGEPFTLLSMNSVSVDWAGSPGGQLCVAAANGCGISTPVCLEITTGQSPGNPVLEGPSDVCAGQTAQFFANGITSADTCIWTVPAGASFTIVEDSIVVDFTGASNGEVCLFCQNRCGFSDTLCLPITISFPPATPTINNGPLNVCGAELTAYCIEPDPNVLTYQWISPNGTFTNADTCITVDWGSPSSNQVCVAANNTCGSSGQVCWDVNVSTPPTAVLSGGGFVCEGSGEAVNTEITLTGNGPWAVNYAVNGQPQNPLSIIASPYQIPLTTPGTCSLISVTDNLGCVGTVSGQAVLEEYPLPTATLSGGGSICENAGDQVLLEILLEGTPNWTLGWQANGVDQLPLSINSSPFSLPINEALAGNIALTDVVDANGCPGSVSGNALVEVNGAPIASMVETTCDATNTEYTVSFVINGGDAATYSISPMDGALAGNVFTSNPLPVGTGYSFTVSDANDCAPVQVTANIVVCNCTSAAGDMEEPLLQFCGEMDFTATYNATNEMFDGDDALCFVLHDGNINQPLATNSTPDFTFLQGVMDFGQNYFICPVVGNSDGNGCVDLTDPCLNVGDCTTVRFRGLPSANMGADMAICAGEDASISVELTGAGPWQISYQDASGNIENLTATSSPFIFQTSPLSDDVYTLLSVEDAFCEGDVFGQTSVSVHNAPAAVNVSYTCDLANQFYTVAFEIEGGDATSYAISPNTGVLLGNIFSSGQIPSGEPFSFELDDAMACGPAIISGSQTCNCSTEAGDMPTAALGFCVNENAVVGEAVGPVLDLDDILIYVLHTASGNVLGNIIAESFGPQFVFDPNSMSPGTTYYISAVAGNADGMGGVDLDDACTDVSVGTPVVFNALPTASIAGSGDLCLGDSIDVEFTVAGTGPFTVFYEINGVLAPPLDIPIAGNFPLTLHPISTLNIFLISITDHGVACENPTIGNVFITVNQPVEAGIAIDEYDACAGESDAVDLFQLISGNDPGGIWTDANGGVVANGQLPISALASGTHIYTYSLAATAPCPDDAVPVSVNIHPNPVADAGADQLLDCNISSVMIGGNGTTAGMDYAWGGPIPVAGTLQPTVDAAGIYTLTVTTPFGCTDMDEVVVEQSAEQPIPFVSVSDISCFGFGDGFVLIDSIVGGQAPYTCSFNGMPFSDLKQFTNLSPGTYSIEISDALGCTAILEAIIAEPQEVTVSIIDPFQGGQQVVGLSEPLVLRLFTTPPFAELDTVVWTISNGEIPCENCEENTFLLNGSTDFTVMISEGGCTDEDFLSVLVNKNRDVYFPNAFSPNNDGINDFFTAYAGPEVGKVKSLLVFDRWGGVVFEHYQFPPNVVQLGWDGKHKGQALGPGVFTWFSEVEFVDGSVELFKGDVVLVK